MLICNSAWTGEITLTSTNLSYRIDCYNLKKHASITITKKVNSTSGSVIKGVTFVLAEAEQRGTYKYKEEKTTDINGQVTFDNLESGKYYAVCERVPEGYSSKNNNIGVYDGDNRYLGKAGNFTYETNTGTESITGIIQGVYAMNGYSGYFTVTNTPLGNLIIPKQDSSWKKITGNVTFKIYSTSDTNLTYTADVKSDGNATFTNIEPGKYTIYETVNTNKGYDIKHQGNNYDNSIKGAIIGSVTINSGETITLDSVTNTKYGNLTIRKKDEGTKSELNGAKFVLKEINGNKEKDYKTIDITSNGKVAVEKIPYGTYKLYEIHAPEGYSLRVQPGYNADNKNIYIAEIKIDDEIVIIFNDNIGDFGTVYKNTAADSGTESAATIDVLNRRYINIGGYVWEDIGASTKEKEEGNNKYKDTESDDNDIKIPGITVNLYYNGEVAKTTTTDSNGEYKFEELEVANLANYYVEFDYGTYSKFAKNSTEYNLNRGTTQEKFIYRPVDSIFDKQNGSKAVMQKVLPQDDTEILDNAEYRKANTGKDSGTNFFKTLSDDLFKEWTGYDKKDNKNEKYPTLHNVNFGIRQMVKPNFEIIENIAYAILNVNGYEYKYTYGNKGDANIYNKNDTTRPTVKWQSDTDITAFTRTIYPSDIPTDTNKVKTTLEIVYRIDIKNCTKQDKDGNYKNIDGVYREHEMGVESLTNEYDATRYSLKTEVTVDETTYTWKDETKEYKFKKDEKTGRYIGYNHGKTKLNMDDTTVFADGIKSDETKSVYISFNVKEDSIKDLLNHPNGIIEYYPTTATAQVKHKYTRYDYSWEKSTDSADKDISRQAGKKYWCIDNRNSKGTEVEEKEGKIHYTVPDKKSDSAPYLALQIYKEDNIPKNRTISGIVFKDNKVYKDSDGNDRSNEVIGDGKYSEEENKISKVKVDLINKEGNIVKLYTVELDNNTYISKEEDATCYSGTEGQYSFEGIVPGEYYIRFTYGDGEQIIQDGENKPIYSNGYKSTIVKNNIVQCAHNGKNKSNNEYLAENEYKWYLDIKEDYNTALEKIDNEEGFFKYEQQIDFRTQNNKTSEVKKSKNAYTPLIAVPIEFSDKTEGKNSESHIPAFNHMSFGIIEKPQIKINIKKEITNIKLTLQNGQVLFSGNPGTQTVPYVANLDQVWSGTGSSYTKVEIDNEYMYGSTLEVTYTLKVENDSELTYTTKNYYQYGTIPKNGATVKSDKEAKIEINTLLEYLDSELKIKQLKDIKEGSGDKEYTFKDNKEIKIASTPRGYKSYELARNTLASNESNGEEKVKKAMISKYDKVYELGSITSKINDNTLRTKKISNEEDSTTEVKVVAQKILSNENDDMNYTSYAQVSQITTAINAYSDPTAAPIVSVNNEGGNYWDNEIPYDEIPEDSSKKTVTPSTGLDRNMKYIRASIIVLATIGISIIFIKKIIL